MPFRQGDVVEKENMQRRDRDYSLVSLHPTNFLLSRLDRQRESTGPLCDLLLDLLKLLDVATSDFRLEVLQLVSLFRQGSLDFLCEFDEPIDVARHSLEILFAETSSRHGRGAYSNAARGESGFITGDGVLVACDVGLFQYALDSGPIEGFGTEV